MIAYCGFDLTDWHFGFVVKIAFVIQRYGENITGGSENLCRQVAEKLAERAEVEVLTSCAEDYVTWENYYNEGEEELNGVVVRRFPVLEPREINSFNALSNEVLLQPQPFIRQIDWLIKQGPHAPGIISYIKEKREGYDVFIFFTYLYFPTYFGLQIVPEKSIFVPTAHDEPAIYLDIYKALFFMPRCIAFNTPKEREFVHRTFKNRHIAWEITGAGIDEPKSAGVDSFLKKYDIQRPYILNMGRIEEGKGSKRLYDYFCKFKDENNIGLDLVFIGQLLIDIGKRDDVRFLGYVPDDDKFQAIKNAKAVIVPSPFESLALAQLEAWICRTPTISSSGCEVTKAHALESGGGLIYSDYEEFASSLKAVITDERLRVKLGRAGYKYVQRHYTWDKVIKRYWNLIEIVIKSHE